MRVIAAYFSCHAGAPGQLYPAHRVASDTVDPVEAAIAELVRGPTEEEREGGLRSFFGPWTKAALRDVQRRGDTVHIDLAEPPRAILDDPNAKSFLPPGLMADITWTVFRQFPDVAAIRLSFDGSEQAFWSWLGGPVRAFTRRDWERV